MAKKNSLFSLYFIGMVLVVVGFCLPMFGLGGNIFEGGFKTNGFSYIGDKGTFITIGALCIFIGAVLGIVYSLGVLGANKTIKLVALLVTVVGGIILVVGFNQNAVYKVIAKGFLKHAKIGFYAILAGWIAGIVGYLTDK